MSTLGTNATLQVRGYRMAGPFTRHALALSMSGCISGTGALLQNSPQLLLLGAVLPHKLRVREKISCASVDGGRSSTTTA
jgi:hypothetical protein